jgi:DNA-binding MarR family transcriptional regulator
MPRLRKLDLELCMAARDTCTANSLRKANRAITGLFDDALRPTGLRISQLSILVALALVEEATVSKLAGLLALDRTTMTRGLAPLERRGLVAGASGVDARHRVVRLTEKGRSTLARALPVWKRVQGRVVQRLGPARWKGLLQGLAAASALARIADAHR